MNEAGVKVVFVYTPEYIEGQRFIKNRKKKIIKNLLSFFARKEESTSI